MTSTQIMLIIVGLGLLILGFFALDYLKSIKKRK